MVTITSQLPLYDLTNQRIFLRADLNVPLHNKKIISDHRLEVLLPTIDLIKQKGGTIVITTHLGRPQKYDSDLSTKLLVPWFEEKGYKIEFANTVEQAIEKSFNKTDHIVMLENLRFFSGEKQTDFSFASSLAQCGDYYVNDAFGALHRRDTSLLLVPELFPPEKRTIGLLVEQELIMLNKLLEKPPRPFTLIVGGNKIATKLPLLFSMLDKIDILLLCPAPIFTLLKVLGHPIGKSLVDNSELDACKQLLKKIKEKNVTLSLPVDYQIAQDLFDGPLSIVSAEMFPENGVGIAIGPKTAQHYAEIILQSQTIFFNGLMGTITRKETLESVDVLFKAMAQSSGLSIIAGGDSVAAAQLLSAGSSMSYLSAGGGSTLAYLSGQELPGLIPFL